MNYSFEEETSNILSASELNGLIQRNEEPPNINPHDFNKSNETLNLAYTDFEENKVKILFIKDKEITKEEVIEVESSIKEVSDFEKGLEFLFDGKYLALPQGLIFETQTGEKVDIAERGDILSYAWDKEDKLVVVFGEEYGEGLKLELMLFDDELNKVDTLTTLAPQPEIGTPWELVVTSHDDKWLIGIDGEIYSFEFE